MANTKISALAAATSLDATEAFPVVQSDTTKKATGALLRDAVGGFGGAVTTKTANYTATATDFTIRCNAASGAITVTLPAAASHTGRIYRVKKVDSSANAVTIDGNAAETIDGSATQSTTTQYASFTIQSNGTNWDII